MKKVLVGIFIVLSYIFIVGFFFTNRMMYIKKKSEKEIIERETMLGFYNQHDYDTLNKKPFSIPSSFGYPIKGSLIAPYETNRYMIICHGVTR
jgi:uncharacterized protein